MGEKGGRTQFLMKHSVIMSKKEIFNCNTSVGKLVCGIFSQTVHYCSTVKHLEGRKYSIHNIVLRPICQGFQICDNSGRNADKGVNKVQTV